MPLGLFDDPVLQMFIFILFIGMTIYIFLQTSQQAKKREPPRKTYTLITCTSTGQEEKREYKEGDYVGKELGTCGDNNEGKLIVKAIYTEEIKPATGKPGSKGQ
ncbi:MAG: hypothetical protein F7C32_00155 [Desulfurococcales archaeon]|nr:hypothetical protein [Desulfurococcales archaeon]